LCPFSSIALFHSHPLLTNSRQPVPL
jgi:hypothetical protein